MFFTASTKEEDVKASASSYINASDYYPVTILAAIVNVSKGGSTSIDFYVDVNGQKQVVYGNLRIKNNDKSPNKIGAKLFNQLLVIANLEGLSDPIDMELPIGKKEALKTVSVLEDLTDIEVVMRVQMQYSVYKGKMQESRNIRAFFRTEDNASAEEVLTGEDIGNGYERDAKYATVVSYEDGLTAPDVEAWISGGRKDEEAPAGKSKPKADPSFGKKRFGN